MKKSLRILLINEKGCFDPGVIALSKILSSRHKVVVVAPLQAQEGIGHALTSTKPIRATQFFPLSRVKIFGVNGTPCDCVGIALDKLLKQPPDLIISGIDHYNNRGETIYSSGIVSSAISGTLHGVKSIALSACVANPKREREFLSVARAFMRKLQYFYNNLPADTTLNVNYPRKFNSKKIKCVQLTHNMVDNFYTHEVNPFGREFYWMDNEVMGHGLECLDQKGDVYWLKQGFITLTPLKYDLTSDTALDVLNISGIGV